MKFFQVLILGLLLACGPLKPKKYGIHMIQHNISWNSSTQETEIEFMIHVTPNVRSIKIYYDVWDQDSWERSDYYSIFDIPFEVRRESKFSVAPKEYVAINQKHGKIKLIILASNKSFKQIGTGSLLTKEEVIEF